MNFLAHCLLGAQACDRLPPNAAADVAQRLGGTTPASLRADLVAGGFLGDFIKGPMPGPLPAALATGVRLHRRIDAFSNSHPGIRQSCDRFPPELRRLAPVLVDVIADHCLARRWQGFHSRPLAEFTSQTYAEIGAQERWLPDQGRRLLAHMRDTDLFSAYLDWPVAERAMLSITRRLRREHLDPAVRSEIPHLLQGLESDFLAYFPDLLDHAADWLVDIARQAATVDATTPASTLGTFEPPDCERNHL